MEISPITQSNTLLLPSSGKNSEIRRITELSRYRGLKNLKKYELKGGYKARYKAKESDPYRTLKQYRRLYANPRQFRSSGKYQRRKRGRGGYRSRLRNFRWPQEYQRQSSEPKYECKPKQSMSGPPKRQPIQYTRFNFKPEQNTDQMLKELEKKLDNKLSKRLLERLEAEFEELMRKVEKTPETSATKLAEQKLEPNKQEVETVEKDVEVWMHDGHGPERDSETVRIESAEDSSGVPEASKEYASLGGSFRLSRTLGLAMPTEINAVESREEVEDKGYENETSGIEATEAELQEEPESSEEEKIEDIETKVYGEIVTETNSEPTEIDNAEDIVKEIVESEGSNLETSEGEVTGIESLEDIEAEEPVSPEKEIEMVPQGITEIETEKTLEPLPEETELFPVEQEPHDIEII